ncbi:hypothetical protein EEB14_16350 [Rhodococcus sp. WS4]|nr:hypothetical protein EEB14_16350 [Rhodococcus sp. WS4]
MAGETFTYPCAITNSSAEDPEAIELAVRWVRRWKKPDQKILLWTRRKADIRENGHVARISRQPDVVVGTALARYATAWNGGPVLGLWLETEDLACIPVGPIAALCIVPRAPQSISRWSLTANAEFLGDSPRRQGTCLSTSRAPSIETASDPPAMPSHEWFEATVAPSSRPTPPHNYAGGD